MKLVQYRIDMKKRKILQRSVRVLRRKRGSLGYSCAVCTTTPINQSKMHFVHGVGHLCSWCFLKLMDPFQGEDPTKNPVKDWR